MTAATGLVRPTDPPTLAVEVGTEVVPLVPPVTDSVELVSWGQVLAVRTIAVDVHPRIDLVCMTVELGTVIGRVVMGVPSPDPLPPVCPAGWLPLAQVRVHPGARGVEAGDITEIRP